MFYERTPLLNYSETEERANFYEEPLNLKKKNVRIGNQLNLKNSKRKFKKSCLSKERTMEKKLANMIRLILALILSPEKLIGIQISQSNC
jgi:hypothetical protein